MPRYLEYQVVDSHTGGEPTRVVTSGAEGLAELAAADCRRALAAGHDHVRRDVICEPRGSDVMVGALLCKPAQPDSLTGAVFFNNVGYLGMCVHGTIGVVETLRYLERITPGAYQLETPVGNVRVQLHTDERVSVENVPSFRYRQAVELEVDGWGRVCGDIAWGGNWFFLLREPAPPLAMQEVDQLTEFAWQVRLALRDRDIRGSDGAEIDHIELYGPPSGGDPPADSRNFVLCPGKAYDRSPCGTGTSAKLACLFADGLLAPGHVWRQESITGSRFEGTISLRGEDLVPTITGRAHVTAQARLLVDTHEERRGER